MKAVIRLLVVLNGVLLVSTSVFAQAQAPQPLAAGIRLASFSPRRAFAESPDGKTGIATLSALQEKRRQEIEARNKALAAQEQALQQSATVLSEDASRVLKN